MRAVVVSVCGSPARALHCTAQCACVRVCVEPCTKQAPLWTCLPCLPAGMAHAATLCYICGGDVDAAVRQWGKAATGKDGQAPSVQALEVRWACFAATCCVVAGTASLPCCAPSLLGATCACVPCLPMTRPSCQTLAPCEPCPVQSLMEKAVVLGIGVNKAVASEALSGEPSRGWQALPGGWARLVGWVVTAAFKRAEQQKAGPCIPLVDVLTVCRSMFPHCPHQPPRSLLPRRAD